MLSLPSMTLIVLAAAAIAAAFVIPPVAQNPDYHRFADQRHLLAIPNFWNVISNVAFVAAGVIGFRTRGPAALVIAFAAPLIAAGSALYHLAPSNQTLYWDRLPMTLAFMATLSAVISRRIHQRGGEFMLAPLLLLGITSVEVWRLTGDLRLYGLVQFYPMLALPLVLLLFRGSENWWPMVGLYIGAKLLEFFDAAIYQALGLSGHTLKHLAAALALTAAQVPLLAKTADVVHNRLHEYPPTRYWLGRLD